MAREGFGDDLGAKSDMGLGLDAVQWKIAALLRFSIVRPPLSQHDANTSIAGDFGTAQCGQIHAFQPFDRDEAVDCDQ